MEKTVLCRSSRLLSRAFQNSTRYVRTNFISTRRVHKKAQEEINEPVKFSDSKASGWKSYESFTNKPNTRPAYQPFSVILSSAIFLIYFCVLREENDVDVYMESSLYDRIPALKEQQEAARIEEERRQQSSN